MLTDTDTAHCHLLGNSQVSAEWYNRTSSENSLECCFLICIYHKEVTYCHECNFLYVMTTIKVQLALWIQKKFSLHVGWVEFKYTVWRTKCHTIDCARNTFLLLQKRLTSGTELILMGWKIVPNEEHVQCDHRFASQPHANKPLHSSQLFDTSLQKVRGTTSLCGPWAALHFLAS